MLGLRTIVLGDTIIDTIILYPFPASFLWGCPPSRL